MGDQGSLCWPTCDIGAVFDAGGCVGNAGRDRLANLVFGSASCPLDARADIICNFTCRLQMSNHLLVNSKQHKLFCLQRAFRP